MYDHNIGLKSDRTKIHMLILPLTSYVLLDKLQDLSDTQFPYLKMEIIKFT